MKTSKNEIEQLFGNRPVRMIWNENEGEYYFSIVDIIAILTESPNPQIYWRVMKKRLKDEGNETVTNCNGLKLRAADGKKRLTDVANTEQILRLIQSISSKKAEPLKLWLAHVGKERIDETLAPELIFNRMVSTYEAHGYSREWINQRIQSIKVRKSLTDEWQNRGVKGKEYALLTDEVTQAWSGMTTRQYKSFKGLKKESLRDNMTQTELVLNMLAETATKDISYEDEPYGFCENKQVAQRGGNVAGIARRALEQETRKSVITAKNARELNARVQSKFSISE